MGDCSEGTRIRWKCKAGCELARGDPISAMYEAMKVWEAPSAVLADSAVLLQVVRDQAELLGRACFGRPHPPPPPPLPPPPSAQRLWSAPIYPPPVPMQSTAVLQLSFEEAFFLSFNLGCIKIYNPTPQDRTQLTNEDLWSLLGRRQQKFAQYYMAYSYLRSKRWVVLPGIQYGADFMAYRHHPALVHSDYAVLVMVGEGDRERLSTWTDLHAMQRLCGSVAKTLLLLHVILKGAVEAEFPSCLKDYIVEAIEVQRWLPEKNREIVNPAKGN